MALEDVTAGADVYSSDGEKLGTVRAIVLEPGGNEVTHIAVDAGPHFPEPGFGDAKIVSVEIVHLKSADGDRVDLDLTEAQFQDMPLYEHRHFFSAPDAERLEDQPGLVARVWNAGIAIGNSLASLGTGITVPAEHFARASFERSILEGTSVWRNEPNTEIGDVERVLVDDKTDEIAALVIKRGGLLQHEVVLPMRYVTEIREGVIHAQLTDAEIDTLERFEP
jgi:uncharacterized protein YrrD